MSYKSEISNLIIYHDKLLEYGGAEVVLESIVDRLKPKKIFTTCLANKSFWENLYKTDIESPWIFSFIKTQKMYRIFYPFLCILSPFFNPKFSFRYNALVYSSTSAKFLSTKYAQDIILYSNFPAKPLLSLRDYFTNSKFKIFIPIISVLLFFWKFLELRALNKFKRIAVISNVTLESYKNLFGSKLVANLEVIHCPVKNSVFNIKKTNFISNQGLLNCILISRLYPEKNLEPLISFIVRQRNVKLTVVGDGPLYEMLINKYGQQVLFTGFVDETMKFSLLMQSDFLLQPTYQEWSLVTVEANILGVPVISIFSDAIIEINHTVGGNASSPNMTYSIFDDIPILFSKIEHKRNLLKTLDYKYKINFSIDSFVKKLNFHTSYES
jgi:glycosyltransferase involved in cell wall biosynthesis